MSATSYGWLVLAFPLAGTLVIALGWRVLPGRLPGWIAHARRSSSPSSPRSARCSTCSTDPEDERVSWSTRVDLRVHRRTSRSGSTILVDPLSVFMCLVVSGVSFLIHLYSVAYMGGDRGYARYFAYLNFFVFSMLLLVLAGNFVILIVGWAFVGAASYLLISFWYRRHDRGRGRHQGVRDQRDRRRRPRDRRVPAPRQRRLARLPAGVFQQRARPLRHQRRHARLAPACCCWSARSRSRPSCRSTPGSRTRWRAPPRSPR